MKKSRGAALSHALCVFNMEALRWEGRWFRHRPPPDFQVPWQNRRMTARPSHAHTCPTTLTRYRHWVPPRLAQTFVYCGAKIRRRLQSEAFSPRQMAAAL